MSEFAHVARRISDAIRTAKLSGKPIRSTQILEIVNGNGDEINCYPGIHDPEVGCCRIAFFVSLTNKQYTCGRGHISFRGTLEKVVQHMQGKCAGMTTMVSIFTDDWDTSVYSEWGDNIEQIKQWALIEAYLVSGNLTTSIDV